MTIAEITALPGGVLVASPSSSLREHVRQSLPSRPWPVQEVAGGADALSKLESGNWQVLFLDRRLPDLDAEELLEIIRQRFPGIEVVLLDSDGGPVGSASVAPETAVAAEMPVLRTREVKPLPGMIGQSAAMERVYRLVRLVAGRGTTVLITGPTGTGKELVARSVHQLSPRAARPFVVVNCAAIPETLIEAELFGHVRGAFTGALQSYMGRIQAAQGGTLFLDEVGELPLSMQAKLLRFLDQKEVQRLGSVENLRVDVRVVAATNADLSLRVESGHFRGDLFYRLSAFPIELPPLDERMEDLVPLAEHFLAEFSGRDGAPRCRLSHDALRRLHSHAWRGNVRELQRVMERAAILAEGASLITSEHLLLQGEPCREESAGWPRPERNPRNR
jgi:DNA-binding NtrC family response regulator